MDRPRALLVESDRATAAVMAQLAAQKNLDLRIANTVAEARFAIRKRAPHIVLCDVVLRDGDGLELLDEINPEKTDLVVLASPVGIDDVLKAMRRGAVNYLPKPVDIDRLGKLLDEVQLARGSQTRVVQSIDTAATTGRFGALIGRSPAMLRVYHQILRVAPTDATVLIQGETGTGKELVANSIVEHSPRRNEPYLTLNCGAVAPALIESELFGHERGAFTGADRRHLGIFERARNGTLLLDEITEMPPDLQVRLLRVLESRRFTRVGGEQTYATSVRVLAATNRQSEEAVREGRLRADLFYRLGAFPIHLPPLRERTGDALLIAEEFIALRNRDCGQTKHLTQDAREWIGRQPWPGNVRELRNVMERGYIMVDSAIDVRALESQPSEANSKSSPAVDALDIAACMDPEKPENPSDPPGTSPKHVQVRVGSTIAQAEKELILATLRHFSGDKSKAAKALGISVKTLYTRLSAYRGSTSAD